MTRDQSHETGTSTQTYKSFAIESEDLDQIRSAFFRWNQRFDQLSAGAFRGGIRFADLDGVQIFEVHSNRVVRSQGSGSIDSFVFSPVTPGLAGCSWRGRTLIPGMVNVLGPFAALDHRTCDDYRKTGIAIRRDIFERVVKTIVGVDLDRLLADNQALMIGTAATTRLTAKIRRDLGLLTAQPSRIPAPIDPLRIVAEWVETLAKGRVENPFRTTSGQRRMVVRMAEEYVRELPSRHIDTFELCELTGVSKRTLHYAFLEVTGISPMSFVKVIKLNSARRDLLAIGPGRGHVESVALAYGFDRPGNFAQDFRRLFGERPSQFLLRRKP